MKISNFDVTKTKSVEKVAKIAKSGQNRCQNGRMLLLNTFHFIILDFGLKKGKEVFSTIFDHIEPIPGQTAPYCNFCYVSRKGVLIDIFGITCFEFVPKTLEKMQLLL